jgi:hypothetical protein
MPAAIKLHDTENNAAPLLEKRLADDPHSDIGEFQPIHSVIKEDLCNETT